jgi:hypothetical protein
MSLAMFRLSMFQSYMFLVCFSLFVGSMGFSYCHSNFTRVQQTDCRVRLDQINLYSVFLPRKHGL